MVSKNTRGFFAKKFGVGGIVWDFPQGKKNGCASLAQSFDNFEQFLTIPKNPIFSYKMPSHYLWGADTDMVMEGYMAVNFRLNILFSFMDTKVTNLF
jgi:hypothetical protein